MSSIRILLVDDHEMVREGLKAMLQSEPDIEVVAETGLGRDVPALLDRMRPDIVLQWTSPDGQQRWLLIECKLSQSGVNKAARQALSDLLAYRTDYDAETDWLIKTRRRAAQRH